MFGEYQYSVFSKVWCKFGVKLAADKMFSIRVADDSEKVNSQTSRGKPGIPAREYKTKKKRNTRQKMRKIHKYKSHMSQAEPSDHVIWYCFFIVISKHGEMLT